MASSLPTIPPIVNYAANKKPLDSGSLPLLNALKSRICASSRLIAQAVYRLSWKHGMGLFGFLQYYLVIIANNRTN